MKLPTVLTLITAFLITFTSAAYDDDQGTRHKSITKATIYQCGRKALRGQTLVAGSSYCVHITADTAYWSRNCKIFCSSSVKNRCPKFKREHCK